MKRQGDNAPRAQEDRRQAILDAALLLVARGGVDSLRYRTVAQEAGVPVGTVSYHFPARPQLIRAAFTRFLEENTRVLQSLRGRFSAQQLDDVADYLVELIRADFQSPRRLVVAEYELVLYAARDAEVRAALLSWQELMVGQLAAVLEPLGVAQPVGTARTLTDIIRGFQLVHLGRRKEASLQDLDDLHHRLSVLLHALASPPHGEKGNTHAAKHHH